MQFLKNVLSTIVGLFLFCFLFFIFIVLIGVAVGSSGSEDVVAVKDNSVIELNIAEVTNDYGGKFSYPEFSFLDDEPKDGLIDILDAIDAAKTDSKIKGISITNSTAALGMAQMKALRDKLEEFKKSGKFVVAYSDSYSQADYYLNSVADTLYLNPIGEVDFKGLSSEVMFFKDFQEKSGIKMEVIRHGKYKSAVEPFLSNEMSPENREQLTTLLNSIWTSVSTDISKSRNIPLDQVNNIATNLSARTADMAKSVKLVDKLGYEDEYRNGIRKALKVKKDEDYNTIEILDYVKSGSVAAAKSSLGDRIAVIYAQGEITGGEGDINVIGEGAMRESLKKAREDKNVKAIVLRVDSPGGSAMTSELIWREIELTKKKKPVVVSMGNLAASGGYYISCNADRIFAEASTITGSIGVFGVLPNLTQLSNKVGIHTEEVSTHANASGYSVFSPLKDNTRAYVQESVENIYKTFVSRVMAGRKMTFEQVDAIGQGRVWAGSDALKIGLVDEIGGLDAAIKHAAKLGKTTKYSTKAYPQFERDLSKYFSNLSGLPFAKTKEEFIKEEVGAENYRVIERIRRTTQRRGAQLILPYEINIK
ncbi:signal peptide peptidase SppA [Flavobacterium sp. J372]|uniref:signal peptide peptidase SppA n=1 Tax=Flavobacterium sp. J372 TaxID=2898436 RepID=UPI002151FC04|nr:signal peptide peptidase SppA [Flavobacterium sp. J372]MCR5860810.1 signal peptide peptidase SppA [Flavobacterium sp. J372]